MFSIVAFKFRVQSVFHVYRMTMRPLKRNADFDLPIHDARRPFRHCEEGKRSEPDVAIYYSLKQIAQFCTGSPTSIFPSTTRTG